MEFILKKRKGVAKMKFLKLSGFLCIFAVLGFLMSGAAVAGTITLSDASSSEGIPAEWLTATLTFAVSGNTLTLTVDGDDVFTDGGGVPDEPGDGFWIHRIGFNSSGDVSNLAESTPFETDWSLVAPAQLDGGEFGTFQHVIETAGGNNDAQIAPGETGVIFTFTFTGNLIEQSDFEVATDKGAFFGAKFIRGGDGNELSSVGANVPIPGTVLLLAPGLILLGAIRRKFRF
jgi:hypothetical protein